MSVRSSFVVVLAAFLAACAVGRNHNDAGTGADTGPRIDAYFPPIDAFFPRVDAYFPGVDAYFPQRDAHVAQRDAFVPPSDTSVPPSDTSVPPSDTSVPPTDMGTGGTIACTTAAACVGRIVISEVATRSSATALDEFVEIQNGGTSPVDLSGVELVYFSASGASVHRATVQAGLVVPPGHFALFASMTFADTTPDVTERWTSGLADGGGTVELRVGTSPIDRFGWGTAMIAETSPYTPAITTGSASYERKANAASTARSMAPGGADELAGNRYDTDHNATDFVTRVMRQPQTLSSPAE